MAKRVLVYTFLIIVLVLSIDIGSSLIYPDIKVLKTKNPAKTSFMQYRERQWEKAGLHKKIQQQWVPLKKISPYLVKAVLIAEDDKFWNHEGFDFEAMQRAFEKDIRLGKLKAGGSTISQQLAKNLFLSPSKNPLRKIKEAILTYRMEHTLSKKRIVELYLNVAEWGDGIFGIEVAAKSYYAKHASGLNADEAARLATVLPNPINYNPLKNSAYVRTRSAHIYRIMVQRGIVIPEYEEVMQAPDENVQPYGNIQDDKETGSKASESDTSAPTNKENSAEVIPPQAEPTIPDADEPPNAEDKPEAKSPPER